MFRDDYANASKLMKIAEDATKPSEDVLPVDNTDQQEEIEEPVNETSKFIEEVLISIALSFFVVFSKICNDCFNFSGAIIFICSNI